MTTKYSYVLLIAAMGVLVIGFMVRPTRITPPAREPSEDTVSQSVVQQLQQAVEIGSLRRFAGRFAEAAQKSAPFVFWAPQFERSAVLFASGTLATALDVSSPGRAFDLLKDQAQLRVQPKVWNAASPLQILTAESLPPESPLPAFSHANDPPFWVIAFARARGGAPIFSTGIYSGEAWGTCGVSQLKYIQTSIPLSESLLGGGVFDMNGALMGIIVSCGDQRVVLSIDEVRAADSMGNSPAVALLNHYGFTIATEDSQPVSPVAPSPAGVLVKEVWMGWPAERAGLLPGDRITEIGGTAVTDASIAVQLLLQSRNVRAMRGAKQFLTTLEEEASRVGLRTAPPAGVTIQVVQESAADKAGLSSGDSVIELNGLPASARSLDALASASKPIFIVARRRNRMFGVWIQP